jgi:hypothetical protein
LTGRCEGRKGRPFVADLEWIIRPKNFAPILEGKYHDTDTFATGGLSLANGEHRNAHGDRGIEPRPSAI